jgi:hypothetical protein
MILTSLVFVQPDSFRSRGNVHRIGKITVISNSGDNEAQV